VPKSVVVKRAQNEQIKLPKRSMQKSKRKCHLAPLAFGKTRQKAF